MNRIATGPLRLLVSLCMVMWVTTILISLLYAGCPEGSPPVRTICETENGRILECYERDSAELVFDDDGRITIEE
jgi:hypothetical protein